MGRNLQILFFLTFLTDLLINVTVDGKTSVKYSTVQAKIQTNRVLDEVPKSDETKFGQFVLATFNDSAPPHIIDKWIETYRAVEGDLVLRIPCKVRGNPKPIITWIYNGFHLANTEAQNIKEDGTLVHKPESTLSGSYTCEAKNYINKDYKTVNVEILPYPEGPGMSDVVTQTLIEEGKPSVIPCNIPHSRVDLVRWFKDGKEIQIGDLRLENPSIRDNGLYTCRVSNEITSKSNYTKVIVGYGPRFISPDPTGAITFIEGSDAFLDCNAKAEPAHR